MLLLLVIKSRDQYTINQPYLISPIKFNWNTNQQLCTLIYFPPEKPLPTTIQSKRELIKKTCLKELTLDMRKQRMKVRMRINKMLKTRLKKGKLDKCQGPQSQEKEEWQKKYLAMLTESTGILMIICDICE